MSCGMHHTLMLCVPVSSWQTGREVSREGPQFTLCTHSYTRSCAVHTLVFLLANLFTHLLITPPLQHQSPSRPPHMSQSFSCPCKLSSPPPHTHQLTQIHLIFCSTISKRFPTSVHFQHNTRVQFSRDSGLLLWL